MNLVNSSRKELISYLESQLNYFFPDQQNNIHPILDAHIDEALERLNICISAVKMWKIGEFDYLHSSQYATFLYFLSNTIYRHKSDLRICTKLFFLNKALNGIDCFYEIEMPSIFFIGHSVGIVLAKATYGNYLAIYQNSTVGKNHGEAPIIGDHVVLYPNSAIIGKSLVGDRSVISQGTSVVNKNTKKNSLVFSSDGGELVFREQKKSIVEEIFRY
jgi:serine O-acetyltransferase